MANRAARLGWIQAPGLPPEVGSAADVVEVVIRAVLVRNAPAFVEVVPVVPPPCDVGAQRLFGGGGQVLLSASSMYWNNSPIMVLPWR